MTTSIARCTNCGAHDVHPTSARSAFFHEDRLVVVQDIPALQCRQCGEQYYDDATIVALDLLRGRGFDESEACGVVSVPVFSLNDAIDYVDREFESAEP